MNNKSISINSNDSTIGIFWRPPKKKTGYHLLVTFFTTRSSPRHPRNSTWRELFRLFFIFRMIRYHHTRFSQRNQQEKEVACQAPSCALTSSQDKNEISLSFSIMWHSFNIVIGHDPSILKRKKILLLFFFFYFISLERNARRWLKKRKVFFVCQKLTWHPLEWVSEWKRGKKRNAFWRCVNNNKS